MFSFLKKSTRNETTRLVCLVTSYAVSGAIVKTFHHKGTVHEPVIIFSHIQEISVRHGNNRAALETAVGEALRHVITTCRKYNPSYDDVVFVIGEPWVRLVNRTAHLKKNESFIVTQKTIDDMVTKETRMFEQDVMRTYEQDEPLALLETSKPQLYVNGYPVTTALGAQVSTLGMHLTFSMVAESITEIISDVCLDILHTTQISFKSFEIAKTYLLHAHPAGTIIELGGVTTTVTVMDDFMPHYFAVIPSGLHSMERVLMELFDITQQQIPRVMSFADDENILPHHRDAYYQRIMQAYTALGASLPGSLAHIKKHVLALPQPIVVIGNPKWLPMLNTLISSDVDAPVIIPDQSLLNQQVIFSHEAAITNTLALAVRYVVS